MPVRNDAYQREGGRHVESHQPQQREVAPGPIRAQAFARPERSERGEQRADEHLQRSPRNPRHDAVARGPEGADEQHRSCGPDRGRADRMVGSAEGDDDYRDLEPLERDAPEREEEARPVEAVADALLDLLLADADPKPARRMANTISPASVPASAPRHCRVTPTATTMATISITSMDAARNVEMRTGVFMSSFSRTLEYSIRSSRSCCRPHRGVAAARRGEAVPDPLRRKLVRSEW